ncbi:MAG: ArgE/DapE family deacylase [Rhodospirillaceae bacterium]|nr:ArgE/DapE family deacylase [Rhodospirillaceae bacterium]
MIDEKELARELTAILSELIAIPSTYPPGDTTEICAYIAARYRAAGYQCQTLSRTEGIASVVARSGSGAPQLALNCHIDTVDVGAVSDWRSDPFQATLENGMIYGLGANNCKASTALHIWLGEEIMRSGGLKQGEIVFTFTGDEERLGSEGMAYLREMGALKPDIMLVGGPTENDLITEERGVLWVRITATGRAAHGGDPDAGDNAILRMIRLVEHLRAELEPRLAKRQSGAKQSTMNIGRIQGGHNVNVVPSSCVLEIDRRLLPDEDVQAAYREFGEILATSGEPAESFATEFLTGNNGFSPPLDGPGITALSAAIEARRGRAPEILNALAVSEGRFFADDNIEIVNFGPGDGATSHAANEHVALDQMVDGALILRDTVARLLGF